MDVEAPQPVPLQVFIVGAPRSGTSILFYAMSKVLQLPGFGESHVRPLFQGIVHHARMYCGHFDRSQEELLVKQLAPQHFEHFLGEYLREFYFRAYRASSWVDKTLTAEAVHGLPLVQAVFPDASTLRSYGELRPN
jgi:hypothetical protein